MLFAIIYIYLIEKKSMLKFDIKFSLLKLFVWSFEFSEWAEFKLSKVETWVQTPLIAIVRAESFAIIRILTFIKSKKKI